MISDGDIEFAVKAKAQDAAVIFCCGITARDDGDEGGIDAGAGGVAVSFDDPETITCTNVEHKDKRSVGI